MLYRSCSYAWQYDRINGMVVLPLHEPENMLLSVRSATLRIDVGISVSDMVEKHEVLWDCQDFILVCVVPYSGEDGISMHCHNARRYTGILPLITLLYSTLLLL